MNTTTRSQPSFARLVLFLLVVAAVSAFAVGYAYGITNPIIEQRAAEELINGYHEVYAGAEDYVPMTELPESDVITGIIEAKSGGQTVGALYTVNASGYGGTVSILVGFDVESQTITGIKILSQSETPGLGANCAQDWFAQRFAGKSASSDLTVVKVATEDPSQVQAITAATITSSAVTDGVNAARQHFAENFSSEGGD